MDEKMPFDMPEIVTYRREELIVETAFTGADQSTFPSDRRLKRTLRPVSGRRVLAALVRGR
jgi:hypothetical protein